MSCFSLSSYPTSELNADLTLAKDSRPVGEWIVGEFLNEQKLCEMFSRFARALHERKVLKSDC